MQAFMREGLAERAGVPVAYADRLIALGILVPSSDGSFSEGDARRIRLVQGMEAGGLPLEGIGEAVRNGDLSFGFLDLPSWNWYGGFTRETYRAVSAEVGINLELLQALHESLGFARPEPNDLVHEEELEFIPVLKVVADAGADQAAVERLIRVWGDSMRRMTEAAANFYHTQIELPLLRSGMDEGRMMEAANEAVAAGIAPLDRALVSMYHRQSEHTWLGNVIESVEAVLERSGLYQPATEPPAMCFLDLSGYTSLTEERGDQVAAETAGTLAGMVQRSASEHGGRPVKWLGDGVMVYFARPADAVLSALDLAGTVPAAGLPSTHTGIDAGPVIMQDGDYFGRTVNTAARIAAHAGPGQVLVTERIVRASSDPRVRFADIGPVSLKGLPRPISLYMAHAH